MAYNHGNFTDEWGVPDDQIDYLQDFDHNWVEQSLSSPLQIDHNLDGQTQAFPRTMSLVQARYATSETSMSSAEEPPSKDQPSAEERPKKRGRKPKSPKDGESPVERRRTQVRLAQQAYRRRKDATQVSLQDECRQLHEILTKIESTFEEFYLYSIEKFNEPRQELESRLSLERTAKELRSLWNMKHRIQTGVTESNGTGVIGLDGNATNSVLAPSYESQIDMSSMHLNSTIQQSTHATSSTNASYGMFFSGGNLSKQLQIKPSVPQPQIPTFSSSIDPNVPFSARLRYEGLKRGYELLTDKNTPFSTLCHTFRFCVFTSTRDQITAHLGTLLQSTHLEGLGERVPSTGNGWPWNMDAEKTSQPNINSSNILSTKTSSSDTMQQSAGATSKTVPLLAQVNIADYMDADNVQRFLISKGIIIKPGASSVSLSRDPMNLEGNMFGEFLGRRGVLLSVEMLLEELVARAVCLSTGPGFRRTDVDEAVHSTLLASL